jgi:hypothetical protein
MAISDKELAKEIIFQQFGYVYDIEFFKESKGIVHAKLHFWSDDDLYVAVLLDKGEIIEIEDSVI